MAAGTDWKIPAYTQNDANVLERKGYTEWKANIYWNSKAHNAENNEVVMFKHQAAVMVVALMLMVSGKLVVNTRIELQHFFFSVFFSLQYQVGIFSAVWVQHIHSARKAFIWNLVTMNDRKVSVKSWSTFAFLLLLLFPNRHKSNLIKMKSIFARVIPNYKLKWEVMTKHDANYITGSTSS